MPLSTSFINNSKKSVITLNTLDLSENSKKNLVYQFICDKIKSVYKFNAKILTLGGPITVYDYMQLCVKSAAGYYNQNTNKYEIFGAKGDFITSPELSQLFGEIIAVWIVNEIKNTGYTGKWQLVEFGAGSGKMMFDMLNAFQKLKISNFEIKIIETSTNLINLQKRTICGYISNDCPKIQLESSKKESSKTSESNQFTTFTGLPINWYSAITELPEQFSVFIANEFLDALPIHQFQRIAFKKWREVYVNLNSNNELCFMLSKSENIHTKNLIPQSIRFNSNKIYYEISPMAVDILNDVIKKFTKNGGFALFVDYGHNDDRNTFSLRAYYRHDQVNVLSAPGKVDITADVNFGYLKKILKDQCLVFGPILQRNFLFDMGITFRLFQLLKQCKSENERKYLHETFKLLMNDNDKCINLDKNINKKNSSNEISKKDVSQGIGTAFKVFSLFPKVLAKILEKRGGAPMGF